MEESREKVVAVVLTGKGVGAIGVILLAGGGAMEVVGRVVRRPMGASEPLEAGQAVHVKIVHPVSGEVLDDAMAVCVGAERFELHVHGGRAVVEGVMGAVAAAGALVVSVEEAMGRGVFGAGVAGEVAVGLARARTMTGAKLLASQAAGGLTAWARHWREWLEKGGELWRMQSAGQWVLDRSARLELLLTGARVAIVGPPNAGKSTLANALLGRQVAITSETAGTTRDWVDAEAVFVGKREGGVEVPVVLVDTAGVRETGDLLERESIARTHQQVRGADAVILVFDGSREPTAEERGLVQRFASEAVPTVVVANKVDAGRAGVLSGAVEVSAKMGTGLEVLMERVLAALDLAEVAVGEPFVFSERQRGILRAATKAPQVGSAALLLGEV